MVFLKVFYVFASKYWFSFSFFAFCSQILVFLKVFKVFGPKYLFSIRFLRFSVQTICFPSGFELSLTHSLTPGGSLLYPNAKRKGMRACVCVCVCVCVCAPSVIFGFLTISLRKPIYLCVGSLPPSSLDFFTFSYQNCKKCVCVCELLTSLGFLNISL